MTDHKPMPVQGYTSQSQSNVELANEGKALEEQYLRWLDKLDALSDTDKRCVALGVTNMQTAAMWAVRSIFKPQRINFQEIPDQKRSESLKIVVDASESLTYKSVIPLT